MAAYNENPAGDANANSEKLLRARGMTSTGVSTSPDNMMNYATGGMYALPKSSGSSRVSSAKSLGSASSSQYTDQLTALKNAQMTRDMAGLDKQKNASLSNLSAEKATIEPAYQKEKMQAGVTAKQTERSFSEYMAQRGGGAGASGIGGQGELLNNVAYQRQYGELGQAEASAISDNARRVTDTNNAYESDKVGAEAGIQAQYLQAYINQLNADRSFNQSTDQFNKNFGLSEAGLSGNYNGARTMAGQTSDANIAQSTASTALSNAQLKEMTDPNSTTNQMSKIGLDTARLNYSALPDQLKAQAQQIAQSLQSGAISIQTAQLQLDYLPKQLELSYAQATQSLASSQASAARAASGGTSRSSGSSGGSSGSKAITQSSNQGRTNTDDALLEIDNQLQSGTSPGNVAYSIEQQREALTKQGVNVNTLIKHVWAGLETTPGEL